MSNEELYAFIKKNPIGVTCAVLSLVLVLAWFVRSGTCADLLGLELLDAVPAAEKELGEKTKEAKGYETNAHYSAKMKEQLDALVAANKEIDARLVRASQLGANYQIFYRLISESGVKQVDLRQIGVAQGAKAAGKTFVPVGFSVTVSGDFAQTIHFLRLLETGPRYCRVLTAGCSVPSGDRNGPCTLGLTVEFLGLP